MCEDVLSPEWQIKPVRDGFGVLVKFPDFCQEEINAFQKQMLESRWPQDESEL